MSKHTIREWEKIKNVEILDPDGFNRKDPHLMERLFTEQEFNEGMVLSTVSIPPMTSNPPQQSDELDQILKPLQDDVEVSKSGEWGKLATRAKAALLTRERRIILDVQKAELKNLCLAHWQQPIPEKFVLDRIAAIDKELNGIDKEIDPPFKAPPPKMIANTIKVTKIIHKPPPANLRIINEEIKGRQNHDFEREDTNYTR